MTILEQPTFDATQVPREIFRACDIRGVVNQTLTVDIAYWLGLSFGSLAQAQQQQQVVVGRDGRHSSPLLAESLMNGLRASGCDVIDIGLVPTPLVYYATFALGTGTGIMITGSHNPANYNGFKMMLAGETLAQEQIQALYQRICQQDFTRGAGKLQPKPIIDEYIQRVCQDIQLKRRLKIVVDCGSGAVGVLAEKLFTSLGCEVIPLYCTVDGDFPFHHPDPGQPKNLQDLIKVVKEQQADLGFAFDGDGDRLGLVTQEGEIVWPDRLMMLFARDLLSRAPGSTIVYDVKCSKHLAQQIQQLGGVPVMYKTGHALIKRVMKKTQAQLAGEMSGHFFFKERWYGFDDACYAACRFLEIFAKSAADKVSTLFANLPSSVCTPEINVDISEEKKFHFIEEIKSNHDFHLAQLITIDGIRVEFADGWGLIRASNTTPCLVLRFEADNMEALARIQAHLKANMLRVAPELTIPF